MSGALADPAVEALRLVEALPFAVLGVTRRNLVSFMNPAAETLLGRSLGLLRGRALTDVLPADAPLIDFIERARREGGALSARSVRLAGPSIAPCEVDLSAAPDGDGGGLVVSLLPLRPQLEESGGEVAAVAHVARMLGHEVKNPLAGIVGAAQLLLRQAREDQHALLALIREEGARIQRIVDRFAAFETFFSPRPRPTNVHSVIDSVVELARASFAAGARIDLVYDPSLPEIDVDPDHLHEACLNLVKNAVEAGAASGKARIVVSTRFCAGVRFAGRDLARARGALEIAVADNGPGVPAASAERIFEPFFTTKAQGAGVGLAVVSEVMSAHGGFVTMESSSGGACFRLLFPIARRKPGGAE